MKELLFGVAYYDEYMPYDRLEQDVAMMKKAGINTVRIAESTWSTCEPQEGVFDFFHVERVMDAMEEAGLSEAEFIRSLIKGYRIKAQPTEEIKSFQRDLYGIANNINQIAKIANSRYSVSHDDYKYISNSLADFILRVERKIYLRQK